MGRIEPYCPLSRGVPRVHDRRIVSDIIFVVHNGLRWHSAPAGYGPHKTIYSRSIRWSGAGDDGGSDIQNLRHVRSNAEKREAEEIAQRERCEDFERFQPLFEQVQRELQSGVRVTRTFIRDARSEEHTSE